LTFGRRTLSAGGAAPISRDTDGRVVEIGARRRPATPRCPATRTCVCRSGVGALRAAHIAGAQRARGLHVRGGWARVWTSAGRSTSCIRWQHGLRATNRRRVAASASLS